MFYPSSENKGADQLRGYREADLRLCFRLCTLLVFPWDGSCTAVKVKLFYLKCLNCLYAVIVSYCGSIRITFPCNIYPLIPYFI